MFRVAKLHEDAVVPTKAHDTDAGYDICSMENVRIQQKQYAVISTGIALEIPPDCYARIAPRSGLAVRNGVHVGAGVVDSGYRDEIKVLLFNHGDSNVDIKKGDRIAQVIFERIYTPALEEVSYDLLASSDRGTDGFGSTGV